MEYGWFGGEVVSDYADTVFVLGLISKHEYLNMSI